MGQPDTYINSFWQGQPRQETRRHGSDKYLSDRYYYGPRGELFYEHKGSKQISGRRGEKSPVSRGKASYMRSSTVR